MKKITVYCEKDSKKNELSDVSYEILSQANRLKKQAKLLLPQESEYVIDAVCIAPSINENAVNKSYPTFFEDYKKSGGRISKDRVV